MSQSDFAARILLQNGMNTNEWLYVYI